MLNLHIAWCAGWHGTPQREAKKMRCLSQRVSNSNDVIYINIWVLLKIGCSMHHSHIIIISSAKEFSKEQVSIGIPLLWFQLLPNTKPCQRFLLLILGLCQVLLEATSVGYPAAQGLMGCRWNTGSRLSLNDLEYWNNLKHVVNLIMFQKCMQQLFGW